MVNALVLTHFMPLVPLTWALRAAGHEVICVGQSDIVAVATEAGLATARVGAEHGGAAQWSKPLVKTSPFTVAGSGSTLPKKDDEPPWEAMGRRWDGRVRTYIEDYVAFARAWQPDLIITDPLEFGGLVVGAVVGVPTVYHRWGIDNFTTSLQPHAKVALGPLCRELGADGLPDPALVIDPCPSSVRSPNVTAEQPVRFIPYNGTGSIPDWALSEGPTRICVAFGAWGTGRLAEDGQLSTVVDSIDRGVRNASGDIETLLLMPAEFRDRLGPMSGSIRLVDPAPLSLCMRHCDIVVHHGGSGSALTAMAYGVPQLVLAQEGPLLVPNGERVQASGAGRALTEETERGDPDLISAALTELLTEPGFAKTAGDIRAEMAAMPSPAEVAALLADL